MGASANLVAGVRQRTQERQVPWTLSSLDGDFVFALATGAATRPPVTPKLEVQEELRQQFGSVALSSRLEDVEVWLGDQRIGQTHVGRALLINNVPEGMHRVLAKKDGYRDFTMDITVVARQTVDIDLKLEGLRPEAAAGRQPRGHDVERIRRKW